MFLIALKCAIVAWVYVCILTQPGQILSWWKKFLSKYLVKETDDEKGYQIKVHWIWKPLVDCEKCVAGQLALWTCVFNGQIGLVNSIVTIFSAILFTQIITGLFKLLWRN